MRRVIFFAICFSIFSLVSPGALPAAKTELKKPLPKIDIKKITLEAEVKGVVPSGSPMIVSVEVNASQDLTVPFAVNLELKKGAEKKKFTENIDKLKQGSNPFKWDLAAKPEDGAYTLSVEIVNEELKLKDKSSKMFRMGEKKTTTASSASSGNQTNIATSSSVKGTKKTTPKSPAKNQAGATQQSATGKQTKADNTGGTKKDESSGPSVGLVGGEAEDKNVNDINVSGSSLKQMTIAGITFSGTFIEQPPAHSGIYLAQGEIAPAGFKISLGNTAGQLKIDKKNDKIEGEMYVNVLGFGKIIQITDLILAKNQIKFKGKFEQKVTIPVVHADLSLAKGVADFEISSSRLACQASGGIVIDLSIPKVGKLSYDAYSGEAGFATDIPPEGISVSGSGTVTIPEPPIEVDLAGSAEITTKSLSGTGSATVYSVLEVASGSFDIGYNGVMTVDAKGGVSLKDCGIEANLAAMKFTVDLPQQKLNLDLSSNIKIMDLITIPGSVKGNLTIDAKAKLASVSGAAGIPLTPPPVSVEKLSAGIKNFLIKITNYNSSARVMELNGDLYISVWTLGGFNGKVTNTILNGKGNFYLPPGLKQLLDLDRISLPVKIDLHSGEVLGELGGEVAGLAIKHFPLEGPQVIVKNDGVHLKGQIGISHVITIPLGDLVFTQTNSVTNVNGDIGIGPFTVAEGSFTFPSVANEGIGFSGKMGIPGLSSQKINGTIYKEGKVDLTGLTKIGPIIIDTLSKFSVSADKLHADTAGFSVGLGGAAGGAAKCSLTFSSLDITKSVISGTATGKFTNVLGIDTSLKGNFSFDGNTVVLTYPDAVSLCGMSVGNATLRVSPSEVSGSGKVTVAGQSKNISITIENGIMKLKGPAGELIAEGLGIANKLNSTVTQTASEEQKVVGEDADHTLDNLSRMSDPWIKDMTAAATVAKNFYKGIEKAVSDEIFSQVKSALDHLKAIVDTAVSYAKQALGAAVDAVCDGIVALIDGVKGIFSDIESLIPSGYSNTYQTIKNKIIAKADALKEKVVSFRSDAKAPLYDLTSAITAIYQSAIDYVTDEANKAASDIKKQLDPSIKEIDQLLTEVGQEVEAAKNAAGDEAQRHYDIAKQKADLLKGKANNIINNYKNKISDVVSPYAKPIIDKIKSREDETAKKRDAIIAQGIENLQTAKKTLDPYIQPFEAAVKELNDFLSNIGGAVFQKFLEGVGTAGNALNSALGAAGKGLVKATDLLGDGVVAASNAAANASQAAHDAAAAAANAASTAASQTYTAASNVANAVQQQATSTVNNVISHLSSISPSSFATGSPVSFSQIQSGTQTVSAKVNSILSAMSGYASSAQGMASSAAGSAGSAISSGASTLAGGVSSGWHAASSVVSGIFGSGGGSPPQPPLDYNAPDITNIAATSTTDSITITWNTSISSRTILFYSPTANVNLIGADGVTKVASLHTGDDYPETTNHRITVTGLNPGTAYYYVAYSVHGLSGGDSTNALKKGPFSIVTQPSTAVIGGIVKDVQNSAMDGVNIYVDTVSSTPAAVSNSTGQYAVEVNPGAHTIIAKKDNYLSSSASSPSLSAGQILPLDFNLVDGRITISGIVKDASSNAGLSETTVSLSGTTATTDANGAFSMVIGSSSDSPLQGTLNATKAGYTTYASSSMNLARGTKMQNVEIKLPHVPPVITGNVESLNPTTDHVVFSFHVYAYGNCSAFIQFGPQSNANYLYQTPTKTSANTLSFDLTGLTASTTYKYRIVLQDDFGNTVIAKESTFITSAINNTAAGQSQASHPQASQSSGGHAKAI